jgi:protoporphyrin/coproporphyrin ferrochelatase
MTPATTPAMTPAEQPSGYDAILFLSFGGPNGPDDVMPFLDNVLRGRDVPEDRKRAVAEHYLAFGGKSPINDQNLALISALRAELTSHGPHLPIYWANRNWHPLLTDTLRQMAADGVRRALAFFTSAYSSYSGCRQYRENIIEARAAIGPDAPQIDRVRMFYNHPGFIEPNADMARDALLTIPEARRAQAQILFTAHSIPASMARGCAYEAQLRDAAQLIADRLPPHGGWSLVYQSRSGPPQVPWLEPDICDAIRSAAAAGTRDVVVAPIGFISDHMEVIYDLDHEAQAAAAAAGVYLARALTVGAHPKFVRMIRDLIRERLDPSLPKLALGPRGPVHDICPADCCLSGARPRPSPPSP